MKNTRSREFTGHSENGLEEAIQDALSKAEEYQRVEVIETRSSFLSDEKRHYQVTLATHDSKLSYDSGKELWETS